MAGALQLLVSFALLHITSTSPALAGAANEPFFPDARSLVDTCTGSVSDQKPFSMAPGDIDGDGDIDFFAAFLPAGQVRWIENLGGTPPTFACWNVTGAEGFDQAEVVYPADLDNDGRLDVVIGSESNQELVWYRNVPRVSQRAVDAREGGHDREVFAPGEPASVFVREHLISNDSFAISLFVFDMDRDGYLDVLTASEEKNSVLWYRNLQGSGRFALMPPIFAGPVGMNEPLTVAVTDVDSDGAVDVVTTSLRDTSVLWYRNTDGTGTAFQEYTVSRTAIAVSNAATARFSSRARTDLIVSYDTVFGSQGSAPGEVRYFQQDTERPGVFHPANGTRIVQLQSVQHVAVGDLDGDGDLDAIAGGFYSGAWIENTDGAGTFAVHAAETATLEAIAMAVDVDNDGALDLVTSTGLWYRNVHPGFSPAPLLTQCKAGTAYDPLAAPFGSYPCSKCRAGSFSDDGARACRSCESLPPAQRMQQAGCGPAKHHDSHPSHSTLVAITVGAIAAVLAVLAIAVFLRQRRRRAHTSRHAQVTNDHDQYQELLVSP